ncbi:MAG: anti-sigma factor [Saprospiraceae bacterium]
MKKQIDIQEYINSGILEQYALGLTTAQQNEEIRMLLQQHPELQTEFNTIQSALEQFAKQYAVHVPDTLKNKIFDSIELEKNAFAIKTQARNNLIKTVLAIAIPLCLFIAYLWMDRSKLELDLQVEHQKFNQLSEAYFQDSLSLIDCGKQLDILRNQNSLRVLLKGTAKSPQSFAAIYYDTVAAKIFLDILDLPPSPAQKQYQLWAIVAGKPVDLGVFDVGTRNTMFKEIKFVSQAQAFAITLEPQGGLPSPTMDQMYVIGGI